MSDAPLVFNGIDGTTGAPLTPAMDAAEFGRQIAASGLDRDVADTFAPKDRPGDRGGLTMDHRELAETGWAIVFPSLMGGTWRGEDEQAFAKRQAAIREQLAPLVERRRERATKIRPMRFRELEFAIEEQGGRLITDTAREFLEHLDEPVDPGAPCYPDRLPYYLLLVGSPEEIPFRVQYQLDVNYSVGRLHFDDVEDYGRYAQAVLAAERGETRRARRMALWGPNTQGDGATQLSSAHLLTPVARWLKNEMLPDPLFAEKRGQWALDAADVGYGTRARLASLLGGPRTPALLFTASHGLYYPPDHAWHRSHSGALLCHDWTYGTAPTEDHLFAGHHLSADADVAGMVAFNFACFGAGVPARDGFSAGGQSARKLAEAPFVTRLPQRLLAHPKGGALAVVGHVDRAWGTSFVAGGGADQGARLTVFRELFETMLKGYPVGRAMDAFDARYAALATEIVGDADRRKVEGGADPDFDRRLARRWLESSDARNYALFGDPAVRLAVPDDPAVADPPAATGGAIVGIDVGELQPTENLSFGWNPFDRDDEKKKDEEEKEKAPGWLEKLARSVSDTLTQMTRDITSLEVRTCVADDEDVKAAAAAKDMSDVARLRAYTRIAIDGDIETVVPTRDGRVDQALWKVHLEMLKEAQNHRATMIKTVVDTVASVVPKIDLS